MSPAEAAAKAVAARHGGSVQRRPAGPAADEPVTPPAYGEVMPGDFPSESFVIDCNECLMQHTSACDDCMVTFLCERDPDEAVVVDASEILAMRRLAEVGLVPALRHRRRTG